ncbi:MAG: hypothetical protein ABL876_00225 [Chitinophagaceae bacterium]
MATTTIFNSTAPKEVGADTNGTANNFAGTVRYCKVLYNSEVVFDMDARAVSPELTHINDSVQNTFELTGSAAIVTDRVGGEYSSRKAMSRTANILNYDNDGSDQPITGIMVIGQGEGNDQAMVYVQNTRGKIPLYEDNMSIKDQLDTDVLTQLGQMQLSANSTANSGYTLSIDPNMDPKYDDLEVGMLIRMVINHGFTQEDGFYAIGRLRNNPTKQGTDQVSMEVFPALDLRMSTSAIYNKLSDAQILFFSDMEISTGESSTRYMKEWAANQTPGTNADTSLSYGFWGPHVDSGVIPYRDADYHFVQDSIAVSGQCIARLQIGNAYSASDHGALLWRYLNKDGGNFPADAYYSYWTRFPQAIHIDSGGFSSNVQIFRTAPTGGPLATIAAAYYNGVDSTFRWYFHLDGIASYNLTQVGGTPHVVPVGDWVHIEMRFKRDTTSGGIWQVWANGVQILNYSGQTANSGATQHAFSIGNYGTKLIPDNPIVEYDDVLISTVPVHSLIFT